MASKSRGKDDLEKTRSQQMMTTMETQTSLIQSWSEDVETRVHDNYEAWVQPILKRSNHTPWEVSFDDVFPTNPQTWNKLPGYDWVVTNQGQEWPPLTENMTTFQVRGATVPDWLYGYLNVDNNVCLPTEGTADDFKDGILAVIEDSVVVYVRTLAVAFREYEIEVETCKAELVDRKLKILCTTKRPVMQVNHIMCNRKVRALMKGDIQVTIATFVEEHRRSDGYKPASERPLKQVVQRTFVFKDGLLVNQSPEEWSAGMEYNDGDAITIGGIRWVHGDRRPDNWVNFAAREHTESVRDDRRRTQIGTPFQPGERASWRRPRDR